MVCTGLVSGDVGCIRIWREHFLTPWNGCQPVVLAAEILASAATCLRHRPLGHQLCVVSIFRISGNWHILWVKDRAPALRILGAGLGASVLVLAFGTLRLLLPPEGTKVRVGLIASDEPNNVDVADDGAPTTRLLLDYTVQIDRLAALGAKVIVLPEKLGVLVRPEAASTDRLLQGLADKTNSSIVVGLIEVSPPLKFNQARIYSPRAPVSTYDKRHLLPPFESKLKPGTALTLLPHQSATWGVAICKDMDFTPLSREYGAARIGLMLVPAWDFNLDRTWHGHIALMRGVESGFSIARAAKQGYLTVSDNRGRVIAESRSDSKPFVTLIADVPESTTEPFTFWQETGLLGSPSRRSLRCSSLRSWCARNRIVPRRFPGGERDCEMHQLRALRQECRRRREVWVSQSRAGGLGRSNLSAA